MHCASIYYQRWTLAYLILGNRHVIGDIRENRRLYIETSVTEPLAARFQFGALLIGRLDVAQDLLLATLIDLWTLRHTFIEWITTFSIFCELYGLFNKLIVDLLVNECSGAGAAAFARIW